MLPAVTPDDVTKGPSCTQRALRTQCTLGPVEVTHSHAILLLVALQAGVEQGQQEQHEKEQSVR
jgi:hypothetical protein